MAEKTTTGKVKISLPSNSEGASKPSGIKPNIAAAVSYFPLFPVPIVLPLVFYLTIGKEDKFVKFHSAQALVLELALFVLGIIFMAIFFVLYILGAITLFFVVGIVFIILAFIVLLPYLAIAFAAFVYKLYLMYTSYKNETHRIPWVADIVDKHLM